MASMKDYLEKAMLRLGSRGAMPGTQRITVVNSDTTGTNKTAIRYVAPADGYVVACSKNGSPAGNLHMYNTISRTIFSGYQPNNVNNRVKATIPVRKGGALEISSYMSDFIINEVIFIKSFGGGLKSLIFKLFPEVRHAYA